MCFCPIENADWFHGDAFGLTAENCDKPLGFRCPNCLRRSSPICPHSEDCAVDEAQLHGNEKRDPSENNKLPSEIYDEQPLVKNEDCPGIHDTGEPVSKRQRIDTFLDSNETVKLENCIAEPEMGPLSVTSGIEVNHLSCKLNGEDGAQMGVVLEEHKLEDSLTGMSTIP